MSYRVEVLADSISPDGIRLVTLVATYPRFIHSELMTHRVFSRNSASSRAIPTEKLIERVRNDPFVPATFNKRVKGMGVGDPLVDRDQEICREIWLNSAEAAAHHAEMLVERGIDKSRANRLLEPFLWTTTIITATEWDNFFALRDHPAAQPEFCYTARLMKEAMNDSEPQALNWAQWHLPLVSREELAELCANPHLRTMFKMVSAGRCARVSYDTHDNFETREASYRRSEILVENGHLSPFEHVAQPGPTTDFVGNFRGWVQMRKEIANEDNFQKILDDRNLAA